MAAKAGAIRAGRAYVELYADNSQLVRGLKMAERQMRAFGGKLKALGSNMTMAGILGTLPAAVSMKWFIEFDDAMRAVKASATATGEQFESLTAKARELGRSTSYTATQVANAMLEMARAGFSPAEIETAAPGMLDLARATGTDLPLATEIAMAALQQFEMKVSEATNVADILVAAVNSSAASLEDMGETLGYVGPVAKDAGMSFRDTAKAIGALSNMGIEGSMAGTSLRQILLQLTRTDVQETLHGMGVEALDASKELRKPGDVLIELGKAMAGMPNAARLNLMRELFDQRAVTASLKLTKDQFQRLNTAIDNASGTARKQAAEMDAGVGGAWRQLTGAIEDVALAVGTALAPTLIKLADYLTSCANGISGFIAENEGLILGVTAVSAGLVLLGPVITGVGMAMMGAATGVGMVTTAVGLLLTPVGLATFALVGLLALEGSATDALKTHYETLSATVTEVFGAMSDAMASGDMTLALTALVAGVELELLRLQDAWSSFWEDLGETGWRANPWARWIDKTGLKDMSPVNKLHEKSIQRTSDIAAAKNKLKLIRQQAAQQAKQAKFDKLLADSFSDTYASLLGGGEPSSPPAVAPSPLAVAPVPKPQDPLGFSDTYASLLGGGPSWLESTAAKIAGLDPAKILQGVGQFMADASQAVPEFVANTAMNLTEDIAPEAGLVSQIQRSARGTFSSLAAGRMGAVGSATNRTDRQLEKLVQKQDHANKRLDQFVDLASKAKLVFTGALPG
jgi:TP901 family phage tail tape measure protein